jgi:hypothetical protein
MKKKTELPVEGFVEECVHIVEEFRLSTRFHHVED